MINLINNLLKFFIFGSVLQRSVTVHVGNINGRIVHGSNATHNLFPYYASVIGLTLSDNFLCGGSIISSDWILTAATCTIGSTKFTIGIGSIFLTAPQISLIATEAYQHDRFDLATFANNIALIKLPATLNFFDNIQRIELVSRYSSNIQFIGIRAIVAGYGRLSDTQNDISMILQWTNVSVISNAECQLYFNAGVVTETNLCAYGYHTPASSPCNGDFGGPLVINNGNGEPVQIGVISFVSPLGCSIGKPSVYVALADYIDWISSVTGVNLN